MATLTKTRKQFILLGGLLALIVIVVIWVATRDDAQFVPQAYQAKSISTDLVDDVFEHPEFKKLRNPVPLPLAPGLAGRENPFEPFK